MRVLLTVAEMGTGGAERIVAELARSLSADGDSVGIAADAGRSDRLLGGVEIDRYVLPGRGRSPLRLLRAAHRLRVAARGFDPDIVHAHNVKATAAVAAARLLRRRGEPPLLTTFHGVERREYRSAARILRLADLVACASAALADRLVASGLPRDRVRVVHNAVEPPDPLSDQVRRRLDRDLDLEGRPVVSIVGRLVPQKAHERFIEAARAVAAAEPTCRFLVVGDGPLRGSLEAMAESVGLAASFRFTGVRDDARELIARSEVLAISSEWEGMPVVAMEAMAAGVPVVATDVEGVRELLDTGAGIVVPREAGALADAVIELLEDGQARARIGGEGRRTIATRFSIERMVGEYRGLYEELVGSRRHRQAES